MSFANCDLRRNHRFSSVLLNCQQFSDTMSEEGLPAKDGGCKPFALLNYYLFAKHLENHGFVAGVGSKRHKDF